MATVYLNGSFVSAQEARISPMDRGFLFADGVYEVVPVFNGRPLRLTEHLRRLERSLDELRMARPMARDAFAALFTEMIQRQGGGDLAIYLQVTRGAPGKRDHGFPVPPVPQTIFMTASALGATVINDGEGARGASAITAEDLRWSRCDIKSVSLLPNVLLRQQAIEAGAAEAVMFRGEYLTEGSSTNVFIVKHGRIATPPRSPLILGGVTRDLVIELCNTAGLPVEERAITRAEVMAADELWVTSSTKDALPIVELDGGSIGDGRPGAVWKSMAKLFVDYKRQVCPERE
jgi:D-alanine transaminase